MTPVTPGPSVMAAVFDALAAIGCCDGPLGVELLPEPDELDPPPPPPPPPPPHAHPSDTSATPAPSCIHRLNFAARPVLRIARLPARHRATLDVTGCRNR